MNSAIAMMASSSSSTPTASHNACVKSGTAWKAHLALTQSTVATLCGVASPVTHITRHCQQGSANFSLMERAPGSAPAK
eukprot:8400301-Pyramimonas_sp.AAC.1